MYDKRKSDKDKKAIDVTGMFLVFLFEVCFGIILFFFVLVVIDYLHAHACKHWLNKIPSYKMQISEKQRPYSWKDFNLLVN